MPDLKLKRLVQRHQRSVFRKPPADHTLLAYQLFQNRYSQWQGRPLILDSCCGVGASTVNIASQYPDAFVLGVDKSEHRLAKHHAYVVQGVRNYQLLRADCADLWFLLDRDGIHFQKHFLLYPNPWPKSSQRQRRWYAMPSMTALVKLQRFLSVRSNCLWYLEEFAWVLRWWGFDPTLGPLNLFDYSMTPFELKYHQAGQQLWLLSCDFEGSVS